jgi:hypothetical protein
VSPKFGSPLTVALVYKPGPAAVSDGWPWPVTLGDLRPQGARPPRDDASAPQGEERDQPLHPQRQVGSSVSVFKDESFERPEPRPGHPQPTDDPTDDMAPCLCTGVSCASQRNESPDFVIRKWGRIELAWTP